MIGGGQGLKNVRGVMLLSLYRRRALARDGRRWWEDEDMQKCQ